MSHYTTLLFFYKDGFGIVYPTEVDVQLNKETELKLNIHCIYKYKIWHKAIKWVTEDACHQNPNFLTQLVLFSGSLV